MQLVQTAKTVFTADTKPINSELSQLEAKMAQARAAQAQLTKGTKEYTELGKDIRQLSAEADKVRESMGVLGMTMGQLQKLQADLNREFKQFGTGGERLQEVNTRMAELRASVASTHQTVQSSEGVLSKFKGWMVAAFSVAAVVEAGRALVSFGKDIFDIGSKFEKYQVVLTKAMGSQDLATKAMSALQKKAAETPFTLDELTGSYVKFVNRGLVPSMDSMTKMGDLAASQGKGFDQLTEAILDAGTGEFERLKEFGIKAKKSGDEVELSFKGVQKTVKLTPEAMQGAIESFGAMDSVAGMMANTMKTGEGQASNFNDKMDALKVMLYQELSPVFKGVIGLGGQLVDGFIDLVKWTKDLWNANQPLVEVIKSLFRTVWNLAEIIWDTITAITGMSTASERAQAYLKYLKIVLGAVATAASVLVGTIGLVIDGLRFLSGQISFDQLKSNATKNFAEIGKSLKATFVDQPKNLKNESKKAGEDLGKAQGDGLGAGQKKAQGETHKALSDKEKKHRDSEADKATKAAEDLAKEELEVRKKLADATDKVWFDSIEDQWEKKRLAIIREYEKDWETQKNLVGDKKELQEDFAKYEEQLEKNKNAALAKLAAEKQTADEKILADKQKAWQADLAKMEKEIDEFNKDEEQKKKEILKADKDKAKELADRRREMFQSLLGMVNDSFNDTIATLESVDTAFAQSQANRIKAVQNGFNSVFTGIKDMKLPFDDILGDGLGKGLGQNIAKGLENAFSANPIAFLAAGKKIIDGINGVFEANRWAKFEAPLRKIIDDSLAAIEDMGKTLEIKMKALEAEGDKLLAQNDATREKLTAAALDFEAEQFAILVKSKEDLQAINEGYSAEELRIKELYAAELNSTDTETAVKAREIVAGLIHDLKISRNEDIENLIHTENAKREINRAADNEIAELNRTAADRTLTEQQALIAAVEANRQADLTKLKDYEGQKAEINRLADEALLAAKTNANNLSIAEQQRLITEIEAKRQLDLGLLATSELGIEAIKKGTAAELKIINENASAETFRIESELKTKQKQAEWQHNAEVYQAQLAAWQAEQKLTIGLLQLQLIKANGKIFNKSEAQAIQAALAAAYSAVPPMPPSGFFNYPSGGNGSNNGQAAEGANNSGGEQKFEHGGFYEKYTGQSYANGGYIEGPSHARGGVWLWNPQTGRKVGEMEGGEYIINKHSTAAHMGLLSAINNRGQMDRVRNSSLNRTGQPYYEDGGIFSTFGPITLNQSNSMAAETVMVLNAIALATGATADASIKTANNTDATAKNTQASLQPLNEAANNSRNLGSIAQATRDTANKDFRPNISIINQQLGRLADIEASARL